MEGPEINGQEGDERDSRQQELLRAGRHPQPGNAIGDEIGQPRPGTVPPSRVASHVPNVRFQAVMVKPGLPFSTATGFENRFSFPIEHGEMGI